MRWVKAIATHFACFSKWYRGIIEFTNIGEIKMSVNKNMVINIVLTVELT